MNALFSYNFGLVHFLHGVYTLGLLELHAPHLTEPSLSYHILTVEVLSVDLSAGQFDFVL